MSEKTDWAKAYGLDRGVDYKERANRFEHHLKRLTRKWRHWMEGQIDLDVEGFDSEFSEAEKSLKELGVEDDKPN